MFGDTVEFSDLGVAAKVKGGPLFGLGVGYHLTDRWAVSLDLAMGLVDFETDDGDLFVGEDTVVIAGNLNVEYSVLPGRFTPLLQAGMGFYNFTVDEPATGSEPCGFFDCPESSSDETDFSWNVGGGLRWNPTDHFVVKLVGGVSWTRIGPENDLLERPFVMLGIGGSF